MLKLNVRLVNVMIEKVADSKKTINNVSFQRRSANRPEGWVSSNYKGDKPIIGFVYGQKKEKNKIERPAGWISPNYKGKNPIVGFVYGQNKEKSKVFNRSRIRKVKKVKKKYDYKVNFRGFKSLKYRVAKRLFKNGLRHIKRVYKLLKKNSYSTKLDLFKNSAINKWLYKKITGRRLRLEKKRKALIKLKIEAKKFYKNYKILGKPRFITKKQADLSSIKLLEDIKNNTLINNNGGSYSWSRIPVEETVNKIYLKLKNPLLIGNLLTKIGANKINPLSSRINGLLYLKYGSRRDKI